MPKIFINGKFLSQKTTGVQRYAREIVKELDSFVSLSDTYELVCPSGCDPSFTLKHIRITTLKGKASYFWEQWRLFCYVKKRKGFLLNLCNLCPVLLKQRNFSTIHDVAFIDNKSAYNWKFRLVYRFLQKRNAKSSSVIFTDSFFSKNRLVSVYSIKPEKIDVIYCGVRVPEFVSLVSDERSLSRPFFFAVGSFSPNKNFKYIIQAAKENPDYDFFIAGESGRAFASTVEGGKTNNLHFLGYLSDNNLFWYYRNCYAFVFPSFYEGFGLPPLEALASGCKRLILSDIPVLREIYGDVANFVDPQAFNEQQFKNCPLEVSIEMRSRILEKYQWSVSAKMIDDKLFPFYSL